MSDLGKLLIGIAIAFGLVMIVATLSTGGSLWIKSWSDPAREEIRRETFRESQTFVEGTTKEIRRYRLEYLKSDSENHKDMLANMAVKEADKIDERHLPEDLKEWVKDMERRLADQ